MSNRLFTDYLKEIYRRIGKGDAREESFYGTLEKLILSYGQSLGKKTDVTVLPKKSEAGQPDFRIWDGESELTGYIEAKPPSTKFLDQIEITGQLKRYLEAYPNVLLTNFFEFRLYRNGILWDKPVKISDFSLTQRIPQFPIVQQEEKLIKLLSYFFDFTHPRVERPKVLAEILASKAGIMRDYVVLPAIQKSEDNYFSWLHQSFKRHLIKDLNKEDFADLFSQTFTYGLSIAKYQYETQQTLFGKKISTLPFTTKTAYDFIQKSFGILREIFKVLSTQEMPPNLEIIVDDIVDILRKTEIYKLLTQNGKGGKKDPIFHLYETFLLKYDKERKIKLGVFYTPLEVVSYIVNSTHALLKDGKLFNAPDGLANYKNDSIEKSVTLLDPAVGTGTFFVSAVEKAIEEVKNKYSSSPDFITDFIRTHILPHFFAFEILIAPYVVSHLKILFSLTEKRFNFKNHDWLRIYLTNTLEFHHKETTKGYTGLFERVLVTEQEKALEVKSKTPILVVIGNPPYSVSSQNKVDPKTNFGKFYESYKEKVRKEERNIQPLSDDYIKFLAFAHWKVKQAGKGIVGMITNNSYLDGLIHRDMREKILEDFDVVYILNLQGDAKRPKTGKDGKRDENVFDIRQGVSIGLLVKPEKPVKKQVYYQELVGSREEKYRYLEKHNVRNSKWLKIKPGKPYWFFVPREFDFEYKYKKFISLENIFKERSAGIATGRDSVLVETNRSALFRKFSYEDKKIFKLTLENQGIEESLIKKWQRELQNINVKEQIFSYSYRPFDIRFIIYNSKILQRARKGLMDNFAYLEGNIAICTTNQSKQKNYSEVFVAETLVDKHLTGHQTYTFPLWLYVINNKNNNNTYNNNQKALLENPKDTNIKKEIIELLSTGYEQPILPKQIFYYIYAILYSNAYRQKYQEFLKIDFPRIPFTKDYKLFQKLVDFGKQLVDLHLFKSLKLNKPIARFYGKDSNAVEKRGYQEKGGKIYISDSQYFSSVKPEIWSYYIGGYQVLDKWLKDRKSRILSSEDIKHYCKIITALSETIEVQRQIDKVYPKVEKSLIKRFYRARAF